MARLVNHRKKLPYTVELASGRIDYRRVFPAQVRPHIKADGSLGPTVHKVSLGRKDSDGFMDRYQAAALAYEAVLAAAEKRSTGSFHRLDSPTIAFLAEAYRAARAEEEEETRWRHGAALSHQHAGALIHARRGRKAIRAAGDTEGLLERWGPRAVAFAEAYGFIVDPNDPEPLARLCRALNDASIAVTDDELGKRSGKTIPLPPAPAPLKAAKPLKADTPALPMLALFDAYAVTLTPGVRAEWRGIVQRLIADVGFDDARQLTAEHLMDWRDVLSAEVTKRGAKRSALTVKKYLTAVRSMLAWAKHERKIAENVAEGVVVHSPRKVKVRDRNFTDDEAAAILEATLAPPPAALSVELARARRWVPWLCAYTGARVNEMGQLRREDVMQVDGVWMIRISPEAGTVKSGEARTAPIHAHLIEQGFLAFVERCSAGPLFYDPERRRANGKDNRHHKKVGEKLGAWVRNTVGLKDKALQPNHGWRHTFKTKAIEADISARVIDAIVGHAAKTVGDTYGSVTPKAKAAAILKFPRYRATSARPSEQQ